MNKTQKSMKSRSVRPPPIQTVVKLAKGAAGPESPLTSHLLEGNAKFDKYIESKIQVWHRNKLRDLTTSD